MQTGSLMIMMLAIGFTVGCGSATPSSPPVADTAPQAAKRDIGIAVPPVPAATPSMLPAPVKQFIARRDECEHFIGEEGYDPERIRFLNEAISRTCTGTDKQLAELRTTYAGDPFVTKRLKNYDGDIEAEAPPPPSGNDK